MGLLELLGIKPATADLRPATSPAVRAASWPPGTVAQLVGGNAISTMFDPGFGVEKHLALLLAQSPDAGPLPYYKSITGSDGRATNPRARPSFEAALLGKLTLSFQFVVTYYGQDVEGFNMFMWNGVRMNGLPLVAGFVPERTELDARDSWKEAYQAFGLTSKPALTIANGNAGWTTMEVGLKMIASPEGKVIWQATVDLPSFPKGSAANEAAVLLMLAHPAYDTGRKPLAYLGAPQVVEVDQVQRREGEHPRVTALREAALRACAAADLDPKRIGSLATDCGKGSPQAAHRLAEVGSAMHDLAPDIDVVHQRVDLVAVLGELGANTVNYTLLLAAYAAYERNHPVLYLSNVDRAAARAMLVLPPAGHVPPDPARKFPEHNYRGQWYAPWWGQRLDGKKDY
ncbi:hypothetical protein CLD22_24370 [Rubrivivax gelatinosus]|nr:hypothetical protein [Rubrivivax gelatinosus]